LAETTRLKVVSGVFNDASQRVAVSDYQAK
jgi:hypothetical protein